jgi:hypothetical protein
MQHTRPKDMDCMFFHDEMHVSSYIANDLNAADDEKNKK